MMTGVELSSTPILGKVCDITFDFRHLVPCVCSPKVTPRLRGSNLDGWGSRAGGFRL